MTDPQRDIRFPNETSGYRDARNALLHAEQSLRRSIEEVAARRRALPLGGRVPEDYTFGEAAGEGTRKVRLSELFAPDKASLILYSFMYGPDMREACPLCTSFLDSLDGAALHVLERANLAVVAKSETGRLHAYARSRGWRNLRLLSSHGTTYNRDYHGEAAEGAQMPMLNVFTKRGTAVHHTYASEMLFAPSEPGQNARHLDLIWPLWHVLDLTPEGRGTDWYPALAYD